MIEFLNAPTGITNFEAIIIVAAYLLWGWIGTVIGRVSGSYENFLIEVLKAMKLKK